MIAVIGIGSNLGSRVALVRAAVLSIRQDFGPTWSSSFYRTPALALEGVTPGPDYVNAAVRIESQESLPDILASLQALEKRFGRERRHRWASRTLDLDILWASEECDQPTVPHPECCKRPFALAPLLDVAADRLPESYARALAELGGPPARCPEPVVWTAPGRVSVRRALDGADALALALSHTGHVDGEWRSEPEPSEGDLFRANGATVLFADRRLTSGSGEPWRVVRVGEDSAEVERVGVGSALVTEALT